MDQILETIGKSIDETEKESGFKLSSDFKTQLYFILKNKLRELKNGNTR